MSINVTNLTTRYTVLVNKEVFHCYQHKGTYKFQSGTLGFWVGSTQMCTSAASQLGSNKPISKPLGSATEWTSVAKGLVLWPSLPALGQHFSISSEPKLSVASLAASLLQHVCTQANYICNQQDTTTYAVSCLFSKLAIHW